MPDDSTIHSLSGWRRAVLWPLAALIRVWGASLQFEIGPADRALIEQREGPLALVLWHNRLFLAPQIFRRFLRGRTVCSLVSASRDGAWLTAFFSHFGIRTVRGSSSRRGPAAALGLVQALRDGYDVGITPDGPRGPCYEFKAGALGVARASRTPLLLLGFEFSSAWRMPSWDRFHLALPGSRVRMRCELVTTAQLSDPALTEAQLGARLRELNPDRGDGDRPPTSRAA